MYKVLFKDLNNIVYTWIEEINLRKEYILGKIIRDVLRTKERIEDIFIKEDKEILEVNIPDFGVFYIILIRGRDE